MLAEILFAFLLQVNLIDGIECGFKRADWDLTPYLVLGGKQVNCKNTFCEAG